MRKAKDKSLLGHGDKRQFTCLASTSAAGLMLPHALVFAGKGSGSLPQWFPKIRSTHVKAVAYHLRSSVSGMTKRKSEKKAHNSSSYTFSVRKNCATSVDLSGVGLFSVTYNHWSDDLTSKAWVEFVLVPYLQRMIWSLHASGKCKAFGVQRCVVLLDVWWGWMHEGFRAWLRRSYPWLLFLYVPAACTPIAQPMDMGIIAKLKAFLRTCYGGWACRLVTSQLCGEGAVQPEQVDIPHDLPTLRRNMTEWLSNSVKHINQSDAAGIVHCWGVSGLLAAWEPASAMEAGQLLALGKLFTNDKEAGFSTEGAEADEQEDTAEGAAEWTMAEPEPEEFLQYVDWDRFEAEQGVEAAGQGVEAAGQGVEAAGQGVEAAEQGVGAAEQGVGAAEQGVAA
jgi:hypothetical protein